MQVYTAQKYLYNSLLIRRAHAQTHTETEVVANAFISAFSSEDRGAEARVYFGPVLDDEGRTGRRLWTSSMSPQDQHDESSKTTTTVATTKATTTTTGAPAGSLRFLPPFSPPGWLWLCLALSFCSALTGSVRLGLSPVSLLSLSSFIRSDALPYPLPRRMGKVPGVGVDQQHTCLRRSEGPAPTVNSVYFSEYLGGSCRCFLTILFVEEGFSSSLVDLNKTPNYKNKSQRI